MGSNDRKDWTDHNESDPGITLLQLFAYLGESLLDRFRRIAKTSTAAVVEAARQCRYGARMSNKEIVAKFWADLYTREWDVVATYFDADSEYTDVPTPAEDVARGPEQIVARLRIGLEPLASIGHDVRTAVGEGDTVVTEHVEHWEWPTGEKAALPFVSMQELRDGKIVRWWDYWDLSTLMGVAPAWWVEEIMAKSAEVGLRAET